MISTKKHDSETAIRQLKKSKTMISDKADEHQFFHKIAEIQTRVISDAVEKAQTLNQPDRTPKANKKINQLARLIVHQSGKDFESSLKEACLKTPLRDLIIIDRKYNLFNHYFAVYLASVAKGQPKIPNGFARVWERAIS